MEININYYNKMANISTKAQQMPASAIRKLVPLADAAKKQGTKVYHLNVGQPDIKSPECALDAVRNYNQENSNPIVPPSQTYHMRPANYYPYLLSL